MREISLDTETTGLSAKDGHRIIEIGAVEMVNKIRTGRHFHVYINPQCEISAGAFNVHGLSNDFLADKPLFETVVEEFLEFIDDAQLVIHNAPFDMGFINHHLREVKTPSLQNERVFDTLVYARKKYPGQKNNLDALCSRLNVDSTGRVKHGALLDAELLADVYAEMMGVGANQRNLLFAGGDEKQESTHNPIVHFAEKKKTYEARDFPLSEAEQKQHAEFLEKIGVESW